jgi:RHS repeat-associated protein
MIIFRVMITTRYENALYCCSARYYDPKISVWLSVDAMAHEFPGWSPYNFNLNSPLNLVDPDGMAPIPPSMIPHVSIIRGSSSILIRASGYNSSQTFKLYGKSSDIGNVSDLSAMVIAYSMSQVGLNSVRVNSTQRTPQRQAEIMYDQTVRKGLSAQKQLYGSNGDKVLDTYNTYGSQWSCTREEGVQAMYDKILELGPYKVSKHCADPDLQNTIDLSYSQVPTDLKKEFHDALLCNPFISRVLDPYNSRDDAFHIEIPQSSQLNDVQQNILFDLLLYTIPLEF